jgi:hypothetical protein
LPEWYTPYSTPSNIIFSNYLSAVDPAWAAKIGTAQKLNSPTGEGAERTAE